MSLSVRSILPHDDAVSIPSQWEKYIASKWFKKVLKNALNLSFETESRSAKDCTPPKENCTELRAIVQSACQIAPLRSENIHRRLSSFLRLFSDLDSEINEGRDPDKHRRQLPERCKYFPVHTLGTITVLT